ncbi:hypothetical protein GCM10010270_79240 [Streptomyces violaceus]|nr:hypothetical protein GCM10010270_79240 [Streptomyces janthinus]
MVTWRRAQMVLLSAQGMPVAKIAKVSFTSAEASNKEHDDGIDWSDHRMGGQPKNPAPKI